MIFNHSCCAGFAMGGFEFYVFTKVGSKFSWRLSGLKRLGNGWLDLGAPLMQDRERKGLGKLHSFIVKINQAAYALA